jgi:hypothetical protein
LKGLKEGRVGKRRLLPEMFKADEDMRDFRKKFEMPNM